METINQIPNNPFETDFETAGFSPAFGFAEGNSVKKWGFKTAQLGVSTR